MIISASYKTDIPAFYGQWFMNRLEAGYCRVLNPYSQQPFTVSLEKSYAEGFVFWTKNIAPFFDNLCRVEEMGFPFIVQYTVNNYPSILENRVIDSSVSVKNVKRISDTFGRKVCVWRYDTIIISELTPIDFHLRNFEALCQQMTGYVDEVVVSFVQLYRKTKINFEKHLVKQGIQYFEPSGEEKMGMLKRLLEIATAYELQLSLCSQPEYLMDGINEARCVDARRISSVAGEKINSKLKGSRQECGCFESRDIGDYDTCPHGCIYCYAVKNHEIALARYKQHDPKSEFLFMPEKYAPENLIKPQNSLF
jgi:Domain of unknown function (DUF1848)